MQNSQEFSYHISQPPTTCDSLGVVLTDSGISHKCHVLTTTSLSRAPVCLNHEKQNGRIRNGADANKDPIAGTNKVPIAETKKDPIAETTADTTAEKYPMLQGAKGCFAKKGAFDAKTRKQSIRPERDQGATEVD